MAYISEHEAPPKDTNLGDNYEPTEHESKTIKMVERKFEEAKKYRQNYDERWNDFYNMFRGRQWKEARPSYRHSEVINLIFREIQSNVAIQSDNRPRWEYLPQEPQDLEFAEILNQLAESDWQKYNWGYQLSEILFDKEIIGTGLSETGFDKNAEGGIGAITFESFDPFYCFPAPASRNVNHKCPYFIKAEPVPLAEIKQKYANGKYVKADLTSIKKMDFFDENKVRVQNPTDSSVFADGTQVYDEKIPEALVITYYCDGSGEIEESQDGDKFVQKKKYPNGRKVVMASKVILEDTEIEFEDRRFPFARVQNYINQRHFWGISDVEQLESPQKTFNKLVSFALDVLTLMGNPIWVVGTGSGVDTENLFNQPGLIVEAEDPSQVSRQEGVQLQPYVLQLIDRMKLWFDDVSGSSDVSRGAKPEGVTAASAIQSLQEATQTRLRLKARNLDAFLQDCGQLYMSRVFQYYTVPRIFRLTQKSGAHKFFKFHVEHSENGRVATIVPFLKTEKGDIAEGEVIKLPIKGSFDVKVATGSNLPFAKAEKENRLLAFFDRGIIDQEEVLKGVDYPNFEAVISRMAQRAAEQQQAQG